MVPTQAAIISQRSDLTSRYGTAAVIGISSIATMRAPDGVMIALAMTTAMPARAITVTADSMRPSARIRRGHTTVSTANPASMIAIAPYPALAVAIAVTPIRAPDTAAPAIMTSRVRRTWSRWVASSGLTGARFTFAPLAEDTSACATRRSSSRDPRVVARTAPKAATHRTTGHPYAPQASRWRRRPQRAARRTRPGR